MPNSKPENPSISFEQFLLAVTSPQFRDNAHEIYDYLQKTAEDAKLLRQVRALCARNQLMIIEAAELLCFMKECRSTHQFSGKNYTLHDPKLIEHCADLAETTYLNILSELDFQYMRLATDGEKAAEIMKDPDPDWLNDPNADILPFEQFVEYYFQKNEIHLTAENRPARFIIAWKEQVIKGLPYHEAIDLQGRPISVESIETQLAQIDNVINTGDKLLREAEDNMMNGFITSLLNAHVKRDNKLYRDVYAALSLYNRIPQEIIESHNKEPYNSNHSRENYIKSKFEKLIAASPEYMMWYKLPNKITSKSAH